jgi:hypothetical protein
VCVCVCVCVRVSAHLFQDDGCALVAPNPILLMIRADVDKHSTFNGQTSVN